MSKLYKDPIGTAENAAKKIKKAVSEEVINEKAVQATIRVTVEIQGEAKPACIIDTISRYYFE
mgnify:CR=1 FL=1